MSHQHFYSRVPARVSLYNKIDGFDTFAHSAGLDREFILGELSTMYKGKLEIHDPVRLRRGEIPKVYSQAMLSTGDIVQTVISYVSKDYTGERSSYLAHSLIIEDSEIESVYHNNGFDAFNPEMFIRDISAFNLTARNAGANPGLAKLNYTPGRITNGRAVVLEYDPQMVKSFIFSVVSAILGEGKPVLFRLPYGDDQLSERALDFINSLMSILPYGLRKQLSFVSYVSRADAYEGFNLKCLGASCGAVDSASYVLYDFASGEVAGQSDEDKLYFSHASFLYSLLEHSKIKDEFHRFVEGIEKKYTDFRFDVKSFTDVIFMFWQCSGFYVEDSVVINDESLCNFLDVYASFRDGLIEEHRVQAYRPFARYLREQRGIPDGVFSRLSRLYPTECVAAKAVALDVLLGLIHVDVMRERLFAFISRNYAREIPSVKAIINNNLCSVFYGGFLQQRILRQFDMYFRIEPVETRDNILDKLLLSIRTPDIQDQILAFIDKYYSIFTSAQKLKLCTTCHEMIPECDGLSLRLIDFVNRRISQDRDIARILATGLCQSIEKSINANNPALIKLLINEAGFTEDVAVAYIIGNNRGVELLISLLKEMPADKRAAKLIRAASSVPGMTEAGYGRLLAMLTGEEIAIRPATVYGILDADVNATVALTPGALVAFRECVIYPSLRHVLADVFDISLGGAGLDALTEYADANPAIKETEEYRLITDYIRMTDLAAKGETEETFGVAIDLPCDDEVKVHIAEYMEHHHTKSFDPEAECTHRLLVSYFRDGRFDFASLYSDYHREFWDELEDSKGVFAKISFCERRAAAQAIELVVSCVAAISDASNQLAFLACEEECGLKKALVSFIDSYGIGAMGLLKKLTEDEHFAICDLIEEIRDDRKNTRD